MSGSDSDKRGDGACPVWDGRFETYEKYCDKTRVYIRGMKWNERDLLPARLARVLMDNAKKMFYQLEPKDQEKILEQGIEHYLKAIKEVVLEGAVPEASRYFTEYFQNFRRERAEGMKSYCTRHRRILDKLEAALKVVSKSKTSIWDAIRDKIPISPPRRREDMKEDGEEDESAGEDKPPDMMNGDHQSEPQGSVKASSKAP